MGQVVKVYVWVSLLKEKSPGHAALQIGENAYYPKEGYISFAPAQEGSISGPGKFFDRHHDDKHYQGRGVWKGIIYGLDTDAMWKQVAKDLNAVPHYGPMNECATTVKRYLEIGGGDEYASWWSSHNIPPISPDDVEDYARSIVSNTKDKGSSGEKTIGKGTVIKWNAGKS